MIKRNYFYYLVTQDEFAKFSFGVITVKSWRADPVRGMNEALRNFCDDTGRDKNRCTIKQFNRV